MTASAGLSYRWQGTHFGVDLLVTQDPNRTSAPFVDARLFGGRFKSEAFCQRRSRRVAQQIPGLAGYKELARNVATRGNPRIAYRRTLYASNASL
jgi:hypothetical protein